MGSCLLQKQEWGKQALCWGCAKWVRTRARKAEPCSLTPLLLSTSRPPDAPTKHVAAPGCSSTLLRVSRDPQRRAASVSTSVRSVLPGIRPCVPVCIWGSLELPPSRLIPAVVILDLCHCLQQSHELQQAQRSGNPQGQLWLLQITEAGEEIKMHAW